MTAPTLASQYSRHESCRELYAALSRGYRHSFATIGRRADLLASVRTREGEKTHITGLPDGVLVFSHEGLDGSGRPETHFWSVIDPEAMVGRRPDWTVVRPVLSA